MARQPTAERAVTVATPAQTKADAARAPAPPGAAQPRAASARGGRWSHLRQAFAMSGAMLTALVALTSGGLALFFQIRPDLLPDPRTHRGASAVVFAVDDGVTLGGFLKRRSSIISRRQYEKERAAYVGDAEERLGTNAPHVLGLPGEDVLVRLTVEGFKSRSVAMLASLYDADTKRRVSQLSDVPVFQQRVDAPSDQSVVEFWMPAPPVSVARYFVRVAVYHRNDGVLLAVADSKRVRAEDG